MEIDKLERLLSIRTVVLLTFLNSRQGVQVYPTLSPILVSRVPTILCFTFDRSYIAVSLTDKEFVVNFMRKKYKREVERCMKRYQEGINKILQVGLTPTSSKIVRVPRIGEADAWLECRCLESRRIGDGFLFLAEVLVFDVSERLKKEDYTPTFLLTPIAKL